MSLKRNSTHELLEILLKSIQDTSPINIQFITQPISDILSTRIQTLETWYGKSRLYGFLVRRGVYPIVLFTAVTGTLVYGIQRAYSRSTKLVLNLLGVIYPTWRCWRLLKQAETDTTELKSWLTYWLIFGSFQVLDHWMESDLFPFSRKKYNLYKVFILYWTQSPHSNGAQVLYRHVVQKPNKKEEEEKTKERVGLEIIKLEKEEQEVEEEEEEHTISIGYSYLDGYNPPKLLSSTQNNSSEDDDDYERDHIHITATTATANKILPASIKSEEETYSLMHTTAEPAW